MPELQKALAEIDQIRGVIARVNDFRGYGPVSVAASGLLALGVALAQTHWPLRLAPGPRGYLAVWIGVAALYVLLALPTFLTLSAQAGGVPLRSLPTGITLMALGLGLESVADWQKFRFKAAYPTRFCNTGLYRIVRCTNYLGEMLFWIGLWFSATSAYQGWLERGLCTLGLACILGIMIGATRRLEREQADHYAADLGYATYRKTVPVLLPFLPLYSLRALGGGRP